MMQSEIRTFEYPGGEIERVQCVRCGSWEELEFFSPEFEKKAFDELARVYRCFVVPKAPYIFGTLVLFHIPEGMELPFPDGGVADRHAAAKIFLEKHYRSPEAKAFLNELDSRGYLQILHGWLPIVRRIMPYGDSIGFISKGEQSALKANSAFFTFDAYDCCTRYDVHGVPIGLCVKDGKVLNPPLFGREALIVHHDGRVEVRPFGLSELTVASGGTFYERPGYRRTPRRGGYDAVIVGSKVLDVKKGGGTPVPCSGFVLNTPGQVFMPGDSVEYKGAEDILFAVQVGNSAIIDGKKTERMTSRFCNIRRPFEVLYPPSLYPLDFDRALAPRMAIGADADGKPAILWAEGPGKNGYTPGADSRGASLKDMADICEAFGLRYAVNMDGGGSAQILVNGERSLKISDRDPATDEETERPVPLGIRIR